MKTSLAAVIWAALWAGMAWGQELPAQTDAPTQKPLELEDVLRLAAERNPRLRAAQLGVEAAAGRLHQSSAIPNPVLSAEIEDFGGSGERRGFDAATTTVMLEQTLELGGKRTARRNVATQESRLAERDREALRLDVIQETTERFIDVLAAQVELALSREAEQTAVTIQRTAAHRVTAGKDPPLEDAKARAELALARLAAERAESRLTASRRALSAQWAGSEPASPAIRGDLARVAQEPPPLARLLETLTRSPEWARWADDIRAADSAVEVERSGWIPDLSIGAGLRQSQADDSQAYVAGLSMELPIFDRRRGSIRAAEAERERKHAEREGACAALRNELETAYETLETMRKAAGTIAREALPAAVQAFAAAQAAYAGGKLGYLDIQDAQRSLFDMRRQQLETLVEYHRAVARIERLTGASLSALTQK